MMMTYRQVTIICQKVHNTYFMQREKTVGATRVISTLKDHEVRIFVMNILTGMHTLCMMDMGRTLVHQLVQGIRKHIMLRDQILERNICPKDLIDMVMNGIMIVIMKSLGTIINEGGILATILTGMSVGARKTKRFTPMKELSVRSMAATLDLARNQVFLEIGKSEEERETTAEVPSIVEMGLNAFETIVGLKRSGGMRTVERIIIN